jgi:G3E family GTPase
MDNVNDKNDLNITNNKNKNKTPNEIDVTSIQKPKPKVVLLGGFLGSGKTTLMMELGKRLMDQGKKVALITNDQGDFLVDTQFAQNEGFSTAEVLNGCFCCRFPDFINGINSAIETSNPDLILTEPVGSCTDLLATVVTPLMVYHKDMVRLAPLFILVDGSRLVNEYTTMNLENPETPKDLLVSHQIMEAHTMVLSKMDLIDDDEKLRKGKERLNNLNPGANILDCSVRTGAGIEQIISMIINQEAEYKKPIDIDYDIYAEAEAEYGWYNGTWQLHSDKGLIAMEIAMKLLRSFSDETFEGEVAHAKLHVVSEVCSFKISFVMGAIQSDGICNISSIPKSAVMTFNVRAKTTPENISKHVKSFLDELCLKEDVKVDNYEFSSLVPAPPKPTHRMTDKPENV